MNRSRLTHHRIGVPVILLTLGLAMAGCSSLPDVPQGKTGQSYSLTINTQPADTREALEARYSGEVISWHPEAGFAIVRSNTAPANDAAVKAVEPNENVFAAPVVSAGDVPLTPEGNATRSGNVWMGGWSAWSGGWSAWSGGWSAWSGGTNTVPNLPPENSLAFGQIRLQQAQASSRNLGAGVKVAVLDTGMDTAHPMFTGRLAPASEWRDFVDNDTNPTEVGTTSDRAFGHGTGVAGVILQVAPRATILPIRVLKQDGSGDLDNVVKGVDWAIQRGAQVINLSLGSDQTQASLAQVLQLAASRKVYVVASAGNEARQGPTFPAASTYDAGMQGYVFGIGSVNGTDILSSFTNYGLNILGVAPGEGLYSAFPGSRVAAFTGTSFAAPLVTGALALGLKELPGEQDAGAFANHLVSSFRSGSIFTENQTARGMDLLGEGRLDVEALIRNLPGWTPKVAYGSTNFVQNGDFSGGSLLGWSLDAGTPGVISENGRFVLRLKPGDWVKQTVTGLQPNTSYTLTAWTRISSTTDDGISFGAWSFGGVSSAQIVAKGTTYALRAVTFTTGPTATSARISLNNWPGNNTQPQFAYGVSLRRTGY